MANNKDNWIHKNTGMVCSTCMWCAAKAEEGQVIEVGRCRRHAPTMNGYPVVYMTDWCGDHKLDADKLVSNKPEILTNEEYFRSLYCDRRHADGEKGGNR